jgi:Leucine-rich repeat (LRR) protein
VGPIPSGLAACKYLEILNLLDNHFVDVIPTWLAQLPRLTILDMTENNLVGSIPAVLSNLTAHLTGLHLGTNQLTGLIPSFLGNFSELSKLSLFGKNFSGSVPPGNIPALYKLELDSNNLDGILTSCLPFLIVGISRSLTWPIIL